MVKFSDAALDRTFAALSDPTRRALVMRLAAEPDVSVSELAAPFAMSLPAVMKHLDVLSDAGLVSRAKTGRVVACRLDAEPMRDAFEWLNRYEKFWSERLSNLAAFLEEEESHVHPSRHQTEPHPQAPLQSVAGQSLRRLDRAGKNKALVRPARSRCDPRRCSTPRRGKSTIAG